MKIGYAFLAVLTLARIAQPQCAKPQFAAAQLFPSGKNPWFAAVGDFNLDGNKDAVVTNLISGNISVLLGNGDGTFQPTVNYAVGPNPHGVVVADFNGDGIPDIAVSTDGAQGTPSGVSLLLGNGDGTFQPPIPNKIGSPVGLLAVGDFNGDGKPDLATAGGGYILLGNGDGTFLPPVQMSLLLNQDNLGIAVADFNGDGNLDVALTTGSSDASESGILVLLGKGNGTFSAPVGYADDLNPEYLATADLNGDGKPDLVAANYSSGSVSVFFGNGNGTFATAVNYNAGPNPSGVAIGDFNGDGAPDLAISNQSLTLATAGVSILLNTGDGAFQPAVSYVPSLIPQFLVASDLNNDGNLDLLVVTADLLDNVASVLGNGDGTFQTTPNYAVGKGPAAIATGDFNGDGIIDLAVANNTGNNVSVLIAKGDGTFLPAVNYTLNSSASGVGNIVTADFNGDGHLDMAIATTFPNSIVLFLGNGDGTFRSPVTVPVLFGASSIAVGDFNGDGKPDLAVISLIGANMLLGNGDGTFKAGAAINLDFGTLFPTMAAADFNGDGKLDLVVANGSTGTVSNIQVFLGNGDGTFSGPVHSAAGIGANSVSVGDFNGDGKPDLAVTVIGCAVCSSGFMGSLSVLLGNGDGTFQTPVSYPASVNSVSASLADFNGDGKLDIAVASGEEPSGVSLLLGNGDGTFQSPFFFGAGLDPNFIGTGDFNGDGKPDMAVVDAGLNNFSVMLNTCTP